jgi:hypothetical protein
MNFFTSPRERKGKDLYGQSMEDYNNVLNEIGSLKSATSDITDVAGVRRKFGLPGFDKKGYASQIERTFAPRRGALATRFARMRQDAGNRMSSSSATPGATFSGIDAGEAGAFGELEGVIGDLNMEAFDKEREDQTQVAQLLKNILTEQDAFAMNKVGMKGNALNSKLMAIQNYLNSLSDDSTFDDILSTGATVAMAAGGLGWNPFGTKK